MNINKKGGILKFLTILLLAITSVSVLATTIIIVNNQPDKKPDNSASDSGDQEGGKKEPEESSGSSSAPASIGYSGRATINTADNTLKLYFKNPCKSKRKISLKLVGTINNEEVTFGEKDNLEPCDSIESLDYNYAGTIEKGNYSGKYILHFIDSDGEEEMVNSEVLINIIVE